MVRIVKSVPTNIVTGFLGAGKTTAINHLLRLKPAHERWAVLVNEFGQIGVDQSLFDANDAVHISEIPGGCLCCTRGPQMRVALTRLLREARPDRLLIEPTGLGHPTGIVDLLQGADFNAAIDLHSMICLVDPQVLDEPRVLRHPVFNDQIELADILVLNKTDLCAPQQLAEAVSLSNNMFPPKRSVVQTTRGEIPLELLDLSSERSAAGSSLSPINRPAPVETPATEPSVAAPGSPLLQTGQLDGMYSYSWLFSADDLFDTDSILALLDADTDALRIKAVLRLGHAWISYNRALSNDREVRESSWRRDSRVEIISDRAMDAEAMSERLRNCLKTGM
ncbi:CobW family GTP-binding protein [Marinobacterium sp. YM272]|uniref:CobW family GTP-binding protein n=1 Tax=Marinobacterium sp. YM272 TaxID=3421654 RepID=UPI003D7F7DAD